jgi:hypothetical protein
MAYGSSDNIGMAVFASEMNGCPYIQTAPTATIELRPFVGYQPRHTLMRLASLPKVGYSSLN